jgi:hypothetical protein
VRKIGQRRSFVESLLSVNLTYARPSPCTLFSAVGAILVNEFANVGTPGFCAGAAYIELFNSYPAAVDIGGYVLSNSNSNFTIPPGTFIPRRGFQTYCQGNPGSFTFTIGSRDTISLKLPSGAELVSTTLFGLGSRTRTYQKLRDGPYGMGPPTPNATNVVLTGGLRRLGLLCPECCGWIDQLFGWCK